MLLQMHSHKSSLSCGAQVYPDVHPLAADDHAEDNWDI